MTISTLQPYWIVSKCAKVSKFLSEKCCLQQQPNSICSASEQLERKTQDRKIYNFIDSKFRFIVSVRYSKISSLSRFSSFFAFKRMAIFNGRLTGNVKLIHTLKSVAPDPEQSWSAFHPLPVHRGTSKLKIMIGQREPSVAFKREL